MVVKDSLRSDLVSSPLKSDKKHRLKQRFDVQRKLGQGTYGKVQLAVNRETGQEVAIKTIKKSKIENDQDLIRIRREIQIMSSIQHPHITHIYEVFENKDKIVLVMQFASGGELYDYLSKKKVLSDLEARRIFRQIAAAVYYCHKNKICHRDLKLENILLDEKGNAKIADFGLSNVFDEKNLLNTYCGSPLYASPEIVKGVPYYGPEVDCWSMGVLLYTLVYGAMPFDGSNFKKLVTQISEGDYFEPKKKSNASELIRKLLTVNPAKRATIVDICVDYWVNVGYEHSLLQVAADMANLTPVRLDLLLALAPESNDPREEAELEDEASLLNRELDKDVPDEEEEEDNEEEYNDDTAANSFAYMKGSHASQLSISSPNLQDAVEDYEDDSETEFLPADIAAALQAECGKRLADGSFGSSIPRISSLAHQSKKFRKSDSSKVCDIKKVPSSETPLGKKNSQEKISVGRSGSDKATSNAVSEVKTKVQESPRENSKIPPSKKETSPISETKRTSPASSVTFDKNSSAQKQSAEPESKRKIIRKDSVPKVTESAFITQRKESLTAQEEKIDTKKFVRPPGKIVIPKTFDSPQSTPSPKPTTSKILLKSESKLESTESQPKQTPPVKEVQQKEEKLSETSTKADTEDINRNVIGNEAKRQDNAQTIEEKKNIAKGILKKGIAKAKLAERRMSKQNSLDSEVSSSCSTPLSTGETGEPTPSFFKTPKPYSKEEDSNVESKAEIKLISPQNSNSTLKNESICSSNAPLWDNKRPDNMQLQEKNVNWSAISSTIDSEMSGWREQMEESLRRLSPEGDRGSNNSCTVSKVEDDQPLVPIARSYKKFTFTKDGACITETKKIYETPGADGSWTKVEKKTKITTRPGNAEEFEKFRDMHLRTDSTSIARSDSQSSSESNDVYDDIFDSWTGDTMMCNVKKMNNMFQKFSRDPFLRRERRRNPFRFFRRTESERSERERRKYEIRSGRSSERESSENDDDYDLHFDDSSAVVYGSQGLWQLLRSANKGFPSKVTIHQQPITYGRSVSQDRSESKVESSWKRCGSRTSSGYNTGTRSQSRDRTESPREKVLRFVFESPRENVAAESPSSHKWSKRSPSHRHNLRHDSGMGSDGYESEYSIRRSPSDEMSRTGRVSSMSSMCSEKQSMIKNFMRSWSKEFMSPPMSPASLETAKERLESLPETRKHRVEQWLDMNSESMPFDTNPKFSSRKSTSSHCSSTPGYATIRPREYFNYNRSASDKLADYSDFFPSFDESPRNRSQSLNKNRSPNESGTIHFRTSAYSPVSEESHLSHRSDSSGSSMHHINFTISDGRLLSSQTTPQGSTRYVRQFSSSKDGCFTIDSSCPSNVRVEQISSRAPSQPVVQMRVSINRNNRDNPVYASPPASKGLWEQQDSLKSPKQDGAGPREPSPVPGIRQFSTEVQHTIGGPATPQMSVECEVSGNDKKVLQTGKNSPHKLFLPTESRIWDMACVPPCMESNTELTNNNKHGLSDSPGEHLAMYREQHDRPNSLPHFQTQCNRDKPTPQSLSASSNGVDTPDSLEDQSGDQSITTDSVENSRLGDSIVDSSSKSSELNVEVKPLGVLWSTKSTNGKETESNLNAASPLSHYSNEENIQRLQQKFLEKTTPEVGSIWMSNEEDIQRLQQKFLEKTTPEVGSIWNQKNASHTLDLLKNLLSDDGLDSFSSSKCVITSSQKQDNRSFPSDLINNENNYEDSPLFDNHAMSVIDNIELERLTRGERFHKMMPSLMMEDLQSPKEVLRQAMKICDSFEQI